MPARHSKNAGDRHHFTYDEKKKAGLGSLAQRLGSDSQLPFGYCALSMHPAEDAVVSPSGHIYSRECIIDYLLTKSKELKKLRQIWEDQQLQQERESTNRSQELERRSIDKFVSTQDGVQSNLTKRKLGSGSSVAETQDGKIEKRSKSRQDPDEVNTATGNEPAGYLGPRAKKIDDTTKEEKLKELSAVCPWVPQFTPQAEDSVLNEPPRRPPSPFSGQPLRSKDLIAITLIPESTASSSSSSAKTSDTKFMCPVSRKTITNQAVVLIKSTGAMMIQEAFHDLAAPTMTCPLSGKRFKAEDVFEIRAAASGFAASGKVEAKVHRPSIN
mmetsp:Transcript_30216/g.51103  ORF Transcript_30216/g.51103 Transcript_30216/m.51103 type:complete len:328 (-) Transcript_30216:1178-2161(-)